MKFISISALLELGQLEGKINEKLVNELFAILSRVSLEKFWAEKIWMRRRKKKENEKKI